MHLQRSLPKPKRRCPTLSGGYIDQALGCRESSITYGYFGQHPTDVKTTIKMHMFILSGLRYGTYRGSHGVAGQSLHHDAIISRVSEAAESTAGRDWLVYADGVASPADLSQVAAASEFAFGRGHLRVVVFGTAEALR